MAKIRVHELAKQLGKDSKEIVAILISSNIEVKNHMSSITEEQAQIVRDAYNNDAPKRSDGQGQDSRLNRPGSQDKTNVRQNPAGQENREKQNRPGKTKPVDREKEKQAGSKPDRMQQRNNDGRTDVKKPSNRDGAVAKNRNGVRDNVRDNTKDNKAKGEAGNNRDRKDNRDNRDNRDKKDNRDNRDKRDNRDNRDNRNGAGGRNGRNNADNNAGKDNRDKKSHITQIYNPQNSGMGRTGHNNGNGQRNGNRAERRNTANQPKPQAPKEDKIRTVTLPETMTIQELADMMKIQSSALIKKLFMEGRMYTVNQEIDYETAEEIALEYDIIAEMEEKVDVIGQLLHEDEEDENLLVPRPPVVCVMGHVDHGKTSLLDAIRKTNVISGEAGGITQHIGAYVVEVGGHKITFLDTPGHEAFTAMRMRGAQSTDIAILVVAADDGVMPQTVEAISHAKAAGISIIVAVNKIDKPSANIDRVKQELAEYELVAEDWGGDTIFVPVSAHTGEGLDTLLEMINLTAEICELKSNPNRKARGLVLEAKLDKGKGPVATVLVQKGTLRIGDTVAAGACYGKVRAMMNDKHERINEAGPSVPVEILGLNNVPNAGEVLIAANNDKEARNIAETFISEGRERLLESSKAKSRMSLDDLFSQIQSGDVKELNLIVKADVQGSVEAVKQSLTKLSNEEVVVRIIHGGVGAINESDVSLASASNAIIIGFNVRPDNTAKEIADREQVDIRLYRVIYQAIEDVEAAMKGLLDPVYEEKIIGHAEVRQLFKASGVGTIAGSYVLDGNIVRNCKVRITREGERIFEGNLASLKRFKDDVKEVRTGYECGLVFENFNALEEGDMVEAYIMEEVKR